MFYHALHLLNTYAAGITILLTAVAAAFKFGQLVNIKRQDSKQRRFENYHELIKKLNQSDTPGVPIKLYRQVAVVYELRKYREYKPVTQRILRAWLASRDVNDPALKPLYEEMQLTIDHLDIHWLQRPFTSG